MYGGVVVYLTILFCSQLTWCLSNCLDSSHNIICQPLPQVVSVNGDGLPYFVELQQCQGQIENTDPGVKRCTFDKYENVRVRITNHGHGPKFVTLKNHTSCKEECSSTCPKLFKHNAGCGCECPYEHAPEEHECHKDFIWDKTNCGCKCNLKEADSPRGKKFDKAQCKYVCRHNRACREGQTMNSDTCRCQPRVDSVTNDGEGTDNTQQGKVLAAVVIGEFVFLYLIFDSILYTKGAGLIHFLREKCRGDKRGKGCGAPPEKEGCLERDEENNDPRPTVVNMNGQTSLPPASSHDASQKQTEKTINKHESPL